jgi:hypothetical protein
MKSMAGKFSIILPANFTFVFLMIMTGILMIFSLLPMNPKKKSKPC